jgi:hypothetical protein
MQHMSHGYRFPSTDPLQQGAQAQAKREGQFFDQAFPGMSYNMPGHSHRCGHRGGREAGAGAGEAPTADAAASVLGGMCCRLPCRASDVLR